MKLLNLFLERIVTVITHFKVTKLHNNQTKKKKTAHSFRQSTTEMERGGPSFEADQTIDAYQMNL